MPNNGYFDVIFAEAGSVETVPDDIQPDGSVSYTEGYGIDYTLNPATNPSAKNIEQTKMNQLFQDITTAIQLQQQGLPAPFITSAMNGGSAFSYDAYATVIRTGVAYQSLVSGNTDTPPSAKWQQINLAPNVFVGGTSTGTANAQINATVSPSASSFTNGQSVVLTAGITNTTTMTYGAGGETPIIVKKNSGGSLVALIAGDWSAGTTITVTKNTAGACWVLTNGVNLGTLAYLGISGNSGQNDGSGNYAPALFNQASTTGGSKTYAESDWGNLIQRSNSGSAMTDLLPSTATTPLPNGQFFYIENTDATATIVVSVGAAGSIKMGNQSLTSAGLIILPGEKYLIEAAGTPGIYNVDRISGATLHASPVTSSHKKLAAVWSSNTLVSITADQVIVEDAAGNTRRIKAYSQTFNSAASVGASGGLDTGVLANTTWYYGYAIFDPATNAEGSIFSASATAPTLPAGYTFASGPLTAFRTDGSGHFLGFQQYGNKAQYAVGSNLANLPIMITGVSGNIATPVWTAVAVAPFVPSIAGEIKVSLVATDVSNGHDAMCAPNNAYGAITSTTNPPPLVVYSSGGIAGGNVMGELVLESASIFYAGGGNQNLLTCVGYTLNI